MGLRNGPPLEVSDYFEELTSRFEPLLRRSWRQGAFGSEYIEYVQDVFLILYRRLPQLRSPKAFPGYFRKVALSVAADHARKAKAKALLPVSTTEEIENAVDRMDEALFTAIFVRSYLEHLPHPEKIVLTLKYVEGLPINEIARELGQTPRAVRSVKARGLRRLRDILLSEAQSLEKKDKDFESF
jgi:RNA polymerase sigma-70 factor (ECF subfamily)